MHQSNLICYRKVQRIRKYINDTSINIKILVHPTSIDITSIVDQNSKDIKDQFGYITLTSVHQWHITGTSKYTSKYTSESYALNKILNTSTIKAQRSSWTLGWDMRLWAVYDTSTSYTSKWEVTSPVNQDTSILILYRRGSVHRTHKSATYDNKSNSSASVDRVIHNVSISDWGTSWLQPRSQGHGWRGLNMKCRLALGNMTTSM